MKTALAIGVILVGLAVGAYVLQEREPHLQPQASTPVSSDDAAPLKEPLAENRAIQPTRAEQRASASRGEADAVSEELDYLSRARAILPKAKAGNVAAQFSLFELLDYCGERYIAYFGPPGKRRSIDDAVALAVRYNHDVGDVRAAHERCSTLAESGSHEFGDAEEWLKRASDGGHDEAQVQWAHRLLLSGRTIERNDENRASGKELLLGQLRKQNPSAIFTTGSLQGVLTGDFTKAAKDQFVWWLAACKAGYDCSEHAEWYRYFCRHDFNCQPGENGMDLILRATAEHNDIAMLADQLLAKIKRSEFDDLNWR